MLRPKLRRTRLGLTGVAVLLYAVGCSAQKEPSTRTTLLRCPEESIGYTEVSPLGFSAAQVVERFGGARGAPLVSDHRAGRAATGRSSVGFAFEYAGGLFISLGVAHRPAAYGFQFESWQSSRLIPFEAALGS
jgi:hypothetical protein